MSKDQPNYFGIIPAKIRYDNSLSNSQKLFFSELTALTQKEGYCWASNNYFADLYEVDPSTVSRWIKGLENKGYISVTYNRDGKQIKGRKIMPLIDSRGIAIKQGVLHKDQGGIESMQGGYCINGKGNNTSNNNTSNNIPDSVIEEVYQLYPRKVGKKKALKKIRKTIKDEDIKVSELKEKVKLYASSVKDKDKQFIPYPATWFNQGRYFDDPSEWVQYKEDNKNEKSPFRPNSIHL